MLDLLSKEFILCDVIYFMLSDTLSKYAINKGPFIKDVQSEGGRGLQGLNQ